MALDTSLILLNDLEKLCRDGQLNSVLNAVNIMDERGLYVSTHILSCLLQLGMDKADSRAARKLYHLLIRLGYDSDCHLASQLIHMHLLCESLPEALQVFGKLSTTDAFLWNSVILAHARLGYNQQTLNLYHRMQECGVSADKHILAVAVKACSGLASLDQGRLIHCYIVERGLGSNDFIVSTLIDMYSNSSGIEDAQRVFNCAPIQNVVAWNTLIKGYIKHGLVSSVVKLYCQMQQQGVELDRITFISILKTCTGASDLDQGRSIHRQAVEKGFELDSLIVARLIGMYGSTGHLLEACMVFEEAPKQDLRIWNAMIAIYAQHGQNAETLTLLKGLQQAGLEANFSTSLSLLKGNNRVISLDQVRSVHGMVVELGFDKESPVMNTFITMYAKCESLHDACRVFNSVLSPDLVTWNAIIGAHAMHEQGMNALQLFHYLQTQGWDLNWATLCASLNACSSVGAIGEGNLIHSFIIESSLECDIMVMNNLIDMYIKCGNLIDAFEVFDSLTDRDVVTWTTLISGCCQHYQYEKGLQLFQEMQEEGVLPNHVTLVSILKACHCLSALDQGKLLHECIVGRGLDSEVSIINALIDMYAKCGALLDGRKVFDKSCIKDVVTWTTMIDACVQHESGPEAVFLFKKMQQEGIEPDRAAFLCAFKACSSVAALTQGKAIHRQSFERGFSLDNAIVNSLIDMYMNCGSLIDAQQVFEEAPFRDIVTWTSMIAGCARHNNYQLAQEYFQNMGQVGIKPNSVTFLSLLSACAHVGLREEGLSHFKSMLSLGISPMLEHFTCIAEVLAHSRDLDAAEDVFETCPFRMDIAGWLSLLPHCKNSPSMAKRCFDYLAGMDCKKAAGFVLMANIYVAAGLTESASLVENLRHHANAWKKPGKAYIELGNQVHEFTCGGKRIPEIDAKLQELATEMKQEGHTPLVDLVLQNTPNEEKERVLCGHCEKQAIAFGLLNTAPGATIRVSKNLRMCADCHSASLTICKIERREIIVVDELCVHVFKDGACSCKFEYD
ncbi:hypothetical protein GOP47_0020375 [Adiantum capillus-veneris]|uniref:DYW domain-containing protein n=1 Tax=Adiantum capillus-veneris TaxID=13818 RepID=A0A9D4Z9E7_ADICA|nr:hypothetical protein GOP47_0020375 [Adiantum capillus-veneris]